MKPSHTYHEILQQPDLWLDTIERVRRSPLPRLVHEKAVLVTGAGTSAYAADAIEAGWPGSRAVPSTDLLVNCGDYIEGRAAIISVARSGDSPESIGVIDRVRSLQPQIQHFAITCNGEGGLAQILGSSALVLDPRTNDRSLAMTSSFSNLTLAGLCFRHMAALDHATPLISHRVREALPEIESLAEDLARDDPKRAVVLASRPLLGLAREACLKILEMTGGHVAAIAETYLGLRHGPMSFLRPDTLVLCFRSSDRMRQCYEEDLISELRGKKLGRIVQVEAFAPELADGLRTPFEIVFAQLLAYHLSLRAGLDPDNPSPEGVIRRVVEGVRIYA
jgi:tagatose-6-phosphate ketose/aldose isomerase